MGDKSIADVSFWKTILIGLILSCIACLSLFVNSAFAVDSEPECEIGATINDDGTTKVIYRLDIPSRMIVSIQVESNVARDDIYCRYNATKHIFDLTTPIKPIAETYILEPGTHYLSFAKKVGSTSQALGEPFSFCVRDVTRYPNLLGKETITVPSGIPSQYVELNLYDYFSFDDSDECALSVSSEDPSIVDVETYRGSEVYKLLVNKTSREAEVRLKTGKVGRTNLVFETPTGKRMKIAVSSVGPKIVTKQAALYDGMKLKGELVEFVPSGYGDSFVDYAAKYTYTTKSLNPLIVDDQMRALKPGAANIKVVCNETGQEFTVGLEVKKQPKSYKWVGPKEIKATVGQTIDLERYVSRIAVPNSAEKEQLSYSVDSKKMHVYDSEIMPIAAGKTWVQISDSNGYKDTISVITSKAKYGKLVLPSVQSVAYDNRIIINLEKVSKLSSDGYTGLDEKHAVDYVEIWRASSKKGKYKYVGLSYADSYIGFSGKEYCDKGLKSNRAYYYKIRPHYTFFPKGAWKYEDWGQFSSPVKYYTAPSHKVKFLSSKRGTVKWKKVKGVKGYVVTDAYSSRARRSVYRYDRHWKITRGYVTTVSQRFVKSPSWKMGSYERKQGSKVKCVAPCVKHGKYYYAHGQKVVKSVNRYKKVEYQ